MDLHKGRTKEKKGSIMASNFQIVVVRKRDSVHLTLVGDFDGSSACELIETVKDNAVGLQRVLIYTSGLMTIYPFGLHVFEKKFSDLKRSPFQLLFTGEHAQKIAPMENMCL